MPRIDKLINNNLKALKKQVNTIYGLENIQTNIHLMYKKYIWIRTSASFIFSLR